MVVGGTVFMDLNIQPLPHRLHKVLAAMPGKTIEEIEEQFNILQEQIDAIEAGTMPIPDYANDVVRDVRLYQQHQCTDTDNI